MIQCPYCGGQNREGIVYCEECGQVLSGNSKTVLPTRQIDPSITDSLSAKATWGTARFAQDASIILHIRDATDPIVLQPSEQLILGRSDVNNSQEPDLDLTPYGALDKGVSRLHAAIHRTDDTLTVVDLGSSNGTHLNGQKLTPDQPRVLRDGDELRLGRLIAHIYFK